MDEEIKKEKAVDSTKKPKKKHTSLVVSIIIIILAIICGIVLGVLYVLKFSKTEIDLAKYVTIEFEGYEGYASFDEDDLIIDEKGLKKVLEDKKLAQKFAEKLIDKATVKENEALENGDEIEVKFKISESWLKENKIKLASDTIKIKVKDLEEASSVDLFKDLEFSYSGISPDLTLSLTNNSEDNFIKNKVTFTMEKDKDTKSSYSLYDIANGDKITVTATYSESDLESAGYVVAKDEYTFTVKGQAEYVTDAKDITTDIKDSISKDMLSKSKSIADSSNYDLTYAYHEDFSDISHYDYTLSHADPELVKMYIAVNNDMEDIGWYDSRNIVYGVYKVTFTDSSTSKTYDYYIPIYAENIAIDDDGLYSGTNYYYYEFYNGSYTTSDGSDYHKSSDEVYNAISNKAGEDYKVSEIK